MLIKRLNATKNPVVQAAIVSAKSAELRSWTEAQTSPYKLAKRAPKIEKVSRQHPAAAPLAKEAERARQRAKFLNERAEKEAITVMKEGKAFFKKNGLRVSNRLNYMHQKRGSWTEVHAQLVRIGAGGKNFKILCDAGQVELTSEWFVANHAPYAVDAALLAELKKMLADVPCYENALKEAA